MDDQDIQTSNSNEEVITEQPLPSEDKNQAIVLLNLEDLIKSHVSNIERLQRELKEQKEMVDNVFASDPTFKEHSEKAKDANNVKSATRQEILKRPSVINIFNKVKGMRADVKELQAELSDYLQEYERMSGSREIEGEDGEIRQIVYTAKLIKKSSSRS